MKQQLILPCIPKGATEIKTSEGTSEGTVMILCFSLCGDVLHILSCHEKHGDNGVTTGGPLFRNSTTQFKSK